MDALIKRLSEPSSWAGLGAVAVGVGQLVKADEAPAVADVLAGTGQAIAGGLPWWQAAALAAGGIAAIFLREKGGR